jgi:conserved repeat domain
MKLVDSTGLTATRAQTITIAPGCAPAVQNPSITITKTPSSQTVAHGGTATFHITVTNNGDVTLTNVSVSDPRSANCNRDLGTLAAGASTTYTCTRSNVRKKFVNTAEAVGTAPNGTTVRASARAAVTVAAIQIVKGPNAQRPVHGVARFRITVTNTGDVRLRKVRGADPSTPSCNRRLGTLAAGASKTFPCTRAHVVKSFVNRAGVVGTAPNGRIRVTDVDAAAVTIPKKPVFTG